MENGTTAAASQTEREPCLICGDYATRPGQALCAECDRAVTPNASQPATTGQDSPMEITTYGQVCKGQKVMDYAEVFGPDVDVWVMATPERLGDGLVKLVVSETGTPDRPPMVVTYEADATTRVVDESAVIAANTWAEAR